jgi:TonB family protein
MMSSIWFHNLAALSLQVALVVFGGALMAWFGRLRAPGARLGYFQLLLIICLGLPLLQPWKQQPAAGPSIQTFARTSTLSAHRIDPDELPQSGSFSLAEAALLLVAAGIAVRSIWLGLGFWTLRYYRRTSSALDPLPPAVGRVQQHLSIPAEFRCSDRIKAPITFGSHRPLVLVPSGYLEMGVRTQEAIACHELIHVRRRDWVPTVIEELVLTVSWFHPGIWWLIGQVRLAREQVVDREVIRVMSTREQYVAALLEVARFNQGMRFAPATRFLRRGHLLKRAAAIVKEHTMSRRRLISSLVAGLCAVLAIARVGVSLFPLQVRAQETPLRPAPSGPIQIESGGDYLVYRAPIEYTGRAIERHIEGPVVLEINVDDNGQVSDARVLSGPDELRRVVLQSVLNWRYDPAQHSPGKAYVTVHFRMPTEAPGARAPVLPAYEQGHTENNTADAREEFFKALHHARLEELFKANERAAPGSAEKESLEKQIAELKMAFENAGSATRSNVTGTLWRIQAEGLADTARAELERKLPVHLGDQINQDAMQRIDEALPAIDERLRMELQSAGDGKVVLILRVPGQWEYQGALYEYREEHPLGERSPAYRK